MMGDSIKQLRAEGMLPASGDGGTLPVDSPIAVKEAVMPFNRFRQPDGRYVDTVLGPEMKSTGEVMGIDADFGRAFAKAQAAAFGPLPTSGKVFVSMANRDKRSMIFPIKVLADLGFEILATQGTADVLRRNGVHATVVRKHFDGPGPNGEPTTVQLIADGDVGTRREHPPRLLGQRWVGARRRLRDPHRRRPRQRPLHHHRPGPRGGRARHRGADPWRHRGPLAAGLGCALRRRRRTTRCSAGCSPGWTPSAPTVSGSARSAPAAAVARRSSGPVAAVKAMGLAFRNALGLAAGFDKNAVGIDGLAALGFGFVEVGTVTALAQPGNARPRLFRLPEDRAVVNRMGFNNDGAEAVARRLAARSRRSSAATVATGSTSATTPVGGPVLGVNIGKSKVVPEDDEPAVLADYATSARLLAPYADYLVVNVSSPNTPGLRRLQAVDRLGPLLDEVRRVADDAASARSRSA